MKTCDSDETENLARTATATIIVTTKYSVETRLVHEKNRFNLLRGMEQEYASHYYRRKYFSFLILSLVIAALPLHARIIRPYIKMDIDQVSEPR